MRYLLKHVLVLGIFLIGSLLTTILVPTYTEIDIIIGVVLYAASNAVVTLILNYKKKTVVGRVERINKSIHNGVWRNTFINL